MGFMFSKCKYDNTPRLSPALSPDIYVNIHRADSYGFVKGLDDTYCENTQECSFTHSSTSAFKPYSKKCSPTISFSGGLCSMEDSDTYEKTGKKYKVVNGPKDTAFWRARRIALLNSKR